MDGCSSVKPWKLLTSTSFRTHRSYTSTGERTVAIKPFLYSSSVDAPTVDWL